MNDDAYWDRYDTRMDEPVDTVCPECRCLNEHAPNCPNDDYDEDDMTADEQDHATSHAEGATNAAACLSVEAFTDAGSLPA